jgi:hypothetical protein
MPMPDANMKAQVQAWQTYYGKPDVAVTNGEESLRKKMLLSDRAMLGITSCFATCRRSYVISQGIWYH